MSSQRGNTSRSRAQKYKNTTAFKNSMHDTSKKTQIINSIEVMGCCVRCKDMIEWKIKYKKYKPLTLPKKCTSCQEKRVKRAYYILCDECIKSNGRCGKCGQNKEHTQPIGLTEAEETAQRAQLHQQLKHLPERKRRAFFRLQESGQLSNLEGGVENDSGDEHGGGTSCSEEDVCSDDDGLDHADDSQGHPHDHIESQSAHLTPAHLISDAKLGIADLNLKNSEDSHCEQTS